MVVVALRERATQGQGWQPDRRASTVLAFLAAMLVCLGFLGLLYRPAQTIARHGATTLFLQAPLIAKARRYQFLHTQQVQPLSPIVPQRLQISPPTTLETPQGLLDAGTRGYPEEQGANGVFIQLPERYDELSRALRAPEKSWTLQQGEGYRSAYGDAIVKSGDGCAAMREVLVAPGGAKALVGFAVPCPGSYLPTMEDGLSAWAKKVKAGQSPP